MTEAVYQKRGSVRFPSCRIPLLFPLSLPGVTDGVLSYGGRRSRAERSRAVLNFTDLADGDYPITLTEGTRTFRIAQVRKSGEYLLDLSADPERIAALSDRLTEAEAELKALRAETARLAEKIGTEEIFTL